VYFLALSGESPEFLNLLICDLSPRNLPVSDTKSNESDGYEVSVEIFMRTFYFCSHD